MAQTPIATDVHQSLDVHCYLAPQVALDAHFLVNYFANAIDLFVGQITYASVRVDLCPLEQLLAGVKTDALNVRQRGFHPLVAR